MTMKLFAAMLAFQQPSFSDNAVLDEWRIPFGDWYDQAVNWIDNNWGGLLSAIKEFFAILINLINDRILLAVPWFVVILAFFFLGWILQNVRVGVFAAVALTVCGLMGTSYWEETARTIGYIVVSVFLCSIIGIPIGIACGRVDAVWQAVRPALDAMQVVHSFVYMLPFIYFFQTGAVSATIVTMVFAIPPLIRLTNLGIRQVPEDVVEASRAFGQNEFRILRDVQLPLARPAVMTGINQCLLLSISMLGIAAIMGAGGLARFMLNALNNQDPALSGSAGLSFFLVAVVLDRLTQREGTTQSMFQRIRLAWVNRRTPEVLLETEESSKHPHQVPASVTVKYEPIDAKERSGMLIAGVGAIVLLVSMLVTWNSDGGWFSSLTRRVDETGLDADGVEALAGKSFNGLAASGGSWFGFVLVFMAVCAIVSIGMMMSRPGLTPRWLNPDGAAIFALASLVVAIAYVIGQPADSAVASRGFGPLLALLATVVMSVGAMMWLGAAKQSPIRPLPAHRRFAPLVFVLIGSLMVVGSGFSAWVFDGRKDTVITAEMQEKLDALEAEGRDPETGAGRQAAIVGEMNAINASAVKQGVRVTDGLNSAGPMLGWPLLLAAAVALGTTAVGAGFAFIDPRRQWIFGTVGLAMGAGIVCVAIGYIGTTARATDQDIVSGVGVLFALIAGSLIVVGNRMITNDFVRSPVYAAIDAEPNGTPHLVDPEIANELGEVEAAYVEPDLSEFDTEQ